jgi:hypothetical protein
MPTLDLSELNIIMAVLGTSFPPVLTKIALADLLQALLSC